MLDQETGPAPGDTMTDQAEYREDPEDVNALGEAPLGEEATETLARVRDLLFGESQRSQQRRVEGVERSLEAALGALEQRIEAREAEREARAERAFEALHARLDDLQTKMEQRAGELVDKDDLALSLRRLADAVQQPDDRQAHKGNEGVA